VQKHILSPLFVYSGRGGILLNGGSGSPLNDRLSIASSKVDPIFGAGYDAAGYIDYI